MNRRAMLRTASNPRRGHSTSSTSDGRLQHAVTARAGISDAEFAKAVDRWLGHPDGGSITIRLECAGLTIRTISITDCDTVIAMLRHEQDRRRPR
jgi:hypothetical protein